jgi:hypothetical protein
MYWNPMINNGVNIADANRQTEMRRPSRLRCPSWQTRGGTPDVKPLCVVRAYGWCDHPRSPIHCPEESVSKLTHELTISLWSMKVQISKRTSIALITYKLGPGFMIHRSPNLALAWDFTTWRSASRVFEEIVINFPGPSGNWDVC